MLIVERGARPPRDATTRVPMSIPCQKCIGCRMKKAEEWGIRCLHEAKMHPVSSYVTLTYANEYMPPGMSVSLRDVQLFMKRLRDKRRRDYGKQYRLRFFLGAEYGDENKRPHYHCLLFNCGFRDMVLHGTNKRGEPLYTSRELSSLWSVDGVPIGFCTIGEVTFESAVYCAKYALKKINGDAAYEHYQVFDESGECFQRDPEFAVMSRFPGIGGTFFDKYGAEIIYNDSVIIEGRKRPVPRYYVERAKKLLVAHDESAMYCRCAVCLAKRDHKRLAVANRADNTPERLAVKEQIMNLAALKKERKL